MSVLLSAVPSASLLASLAWPQAARVCPEDLRRLTGARRTCTLTYTDYSSGRRVSIPSNLFVTERDGDGRAALFRYTYLVGASAFTVRKKVRHDGADRFFERNVYSWSR